MFALKDNILDAIFQGVIYIRNHQEKDGGFVNFSSPNPKNFTNALRFHATFSTSLILDSLTNLPETPQIKVIKQKAAIFLLKQKSKNWSFNYWTRNSDEAKTIPYPDDLDDTFCALSALFHYDHKIIDGSVLARVVSILTTVEEKEGGPYRTWLVPETAEEIWKDVDIAVNSNVAYFLFLQGIDLPQLNAYIDMCIKTNKITSPYYPTDYPILYFISRFYKGKYKGKIQQVLFSRKNNKGNWDNPLDTALAVTTLLHFQTPIQKLTDSVEYLIQQQKSFWKPYPFYTGVNPKRDKTYYAGSPVLTTAFCLETLIKYFNMTTPSAIEMKKDPEKKRFYNQIVKIVEERFSTFDIPMQKYVSTLLPAMLEKDAQRQIVLLPYYFTHMLGEKKNNIDPDLIKKLGTASVFGWMAYTIYDNFLDDEGDPKMLSAANIALRELTSIFAHIVPDNPELQEFFHRIMDQLDQANTWEVTYCRVKITKGKMDSKDIKIPHYGNYQKLAEKSLGHGLGPLAILFSLGYNKNSSEIKNLLAFFTHYLIARQLNDDAHDWEKDLSMGHINSVGALLLKSVYQKEFQKKKKVSFKKLLPKLQKLFWYTVIETVCALVYTHTKKARIALKRCSILVDHTVFEALLVRYEKAAELALEERKKTIKFLRSYNSR